jgi:hypothetical protein
MKLRQIETRAFESGERAVTNIIRRIVSRTVTRGDVPSDVTVAGVNGGVAITGKRLRRRMIDDPKLRNFAHE